MVYKDYWALSQWYRHYGQLVGYENLFVVAHGADPKVAKICPLASIITIPRDTLDSFDRRRNRLLNSFADGLGLSYDWVIRTDADELICYDPALYGTISEVLSATDGSALFALGLNVAETVNDRPLGPKVQALAHRSNAMFTGHYSKAWATRRGTPLWRHGIWVSTKKLDTAPFSLPKGVYLIHLKYANLDALEHANEHRKEVGNTKGKGLPGAAWKDADRDAARFYAKLAKSSELEWSIARDKAYASIASEPIRDAQENVLRSQSKTFDFWVTLPAWFKSGFG